MNGEKIRTWIFRPKRLPNTRKGISFALCDAVLVVLATAVYFTAKAIGHKLGTNWLIGFIVGAKLLATPLFFAWAQFAMNLENRLNIGAFMPTSILEEKLDESGFKLENDEFKKTADEAMQIAGVLKKSDLSEHIPHAGDLLI